MILVDTNVVSETTRKRPHPGALEWLARQESVVLSAVSVQELVFGVEIAPREKKPLLEEWLSALLQNPAFEIVPFDEAAALQTGRLLARCRRAGRTLPTIDAQVAGTALSRSAVLATRNTAHFKGLEVPLLDPFASPGPDAS